MHKLTPKPDKPSNTLWETLSGQKLFGFGGLPPEFAKLYRDFGLEPSSSNGHELAIRIAQKYIKEFKIKKQRGPKKQKWDEAHAIQFHMLVWIKKTKRKCSVREACSLAAKQLGMKQKIDALNTRYYELLKTEKVKKQQQIFEKFEKNDPNFLQGLEKFYNETYTKLE